MVTRRQLLKNTAVGFGSVALAGLMGQGTANAEEPNLLQLVNRGLKIQLKK